MGAIGTKGTNIRGNVNRYEHRDTELKGRSRCTGANSTLCRAGAGLHHRLIA